MSTIAQEILDSIETLIGSSLDKQKNVKVIECTIVDIVDASIGLYSVEYLKQTLRAYSNTITTHYSKGDSVFVLSKDGALDSTLTIIGSSNPYVGLYDITSEVQYKKIGESIFDSVTDLAFCTYHSPEEKDANAIAGSNFNIIFSHYLERNKTFCLSLDVKTAIEDPYQKVNGDYGIELTLPFKRITGDATEEVTKTYYFNTEKMNGSPYDFVDYVTQKLYVTIEDDLIYDNSRANEIQIKGFCKDFGVSNDSRYDDYYDIFLSNIQFYPVEVIDSSETAGYHLLLTATEGNFFLGSRFRTVKKIIPTLLINGAETSLNNLACYWFVQDSSVVYGSQNYNTLGGYGWRCLNTYSEQESSDGTVSESILNTDEYSLTVKQSDVETSAKYKCIIIYNGTNVGQTILIENLDSQVSISLESSPAFALKNDLITLTCKVNTLSDYSEDNSYLTYAWMRYGSDGDYIDNNFWNKGENCRTNYVSVIDETTGQREYITDIQFYGSLITNDMNLIVCTVYRTDSNGNNKLVGTVQKLIAINSVDGSYLSMSNSNKLYKYDSYGNSPQSEFYDGPLSSRISTIDPLSCTIYDAAGEEYSEETYNTCLFTWTLPKNSMMNFDINGYKKAKNIQFSETDDSYIVSKYGKFDIDYTISKNYNYNKNNNVVYLNVVNNDLLLSGTADIQFIKEGDNGTNGTKYSAVLTYNGVGYGKKDFTGIEQKLKLMFIADDTSTHGPWYILPTNSDLIDSNFCDVNYFPPAGLNPLGVEVYKDGVLVANPFDYNIEWGIFDEAAIKPFFTMTSDGRLCIATNRNSDWNTTAIGDNKILVIQAKITINSGSKEEADTVIYAFYPVELIRVDKELFDKMTYFPSLTKGYSIVTYAADGSNPQWDGGNSGAIFNINSGMEINGDIDCFNYEWRLSEKLLMKEKIQQTSADIRPVSKYDDGMANNYVSVVMSPNISGEGSLTPEEVSEKLLEIQTSLDVDTSEIARNVIQYEELKNLATTFDIEPTQKELDTIAEINAVDAKITEQNNNKETATSNYQTALERTYYDRGDDNYATSINSIISELKDYEKKIYDILIQIFKTNSFYGRYKDTANLIENTDYINALQEILEIQNPTINNINYSSKESSYQSALHNLAEAQELLKRFMVVVDEAEVATLKAQIDNYDILTDYSEIESLLPSADSADAAVGVTVITDEIEGLNEQDADYDDRYNAWYSLLDNYTSSYATAAKQVSTWTKASQDLKEDILTNYVKPLSDLITAYITNTDVSYWNNSYVVELSEEVVNDISLVLQSDINNLTNIKNCDLGTYTTQELLDTYNKLSTRVKNIYNNNINLFEYKYLLNNSSIPNLQYFLDKYTNLTILTENYENTLSIINNGVNQDGQDENCIQYLEDEKAQLQVVLKDCYKNRISEIVNWVADVNNDNPYLTYRSDLLNKLSTIEKILNNYQHLFQVTFDTTTQAEIIDAGYDFLTYILSAKLEIYKLRNKVYGLISDKFTKSDLTNLSTLSTGISGHTAAWTKDFLKPFITDTDGNTITNSVVDTINSYDNTVSEISSLITSIKALSAQEEDTIKNIYSKISDFIALPQVSSTDITISNIYDKIANLYDVSSIDLIERSKLETDVIAQVTYLLANKEEYSSLQILSEICQSTGRDFVSWQQSLNNLLSKFYLLDSNSYTLEELQSAWMGRQNKVISSVNYQSILIKNFVDLLSSFYDCIYSDNSITINMDPETGEFIKINPFMNLDSHDSELINNVDSLLEEYNILRARQKIVTLTDPSYIVYLKPIIFRLNTNEFGWLNDWDGNKLYIDENGEYIIAPQIGAGAKDEANRFTGITMGVKKTAESTKSQIGLFGFSAGRQSIFLDAKTGKAQFGLSKAGQITLDPTDDVARLYSGNFYEWNTDGTANYNKETGKGMLIDLTTPEIRFGNGGFWVDKNGQMHVGGTDKTEATGNIDSGNSEENGLIDIDDTGLYYYNGYDKFYWEEANGDYEATIVKHGFESTLTPLLMTDSSGYYHYDDNGEDIQVYFCRDGYDLRDSNGNIVNSGSIGPYVRRTTIQTYDSTSSLQDTVCYYFYDDNDVIHYYFYDRDLEKYLFYDSTEVRFWYWDEELMSKVYYEPDTNMYFYYLDGVKTYLKAKSSELGGWRIGEDRIFSENHKMTLYSAYNSPNKSPAIYSGDGYSGDLTEASERRLHSSFESEKNGFYLGDEGLSIGKIVRANNNEFYLGNNNKKYFRAYVDDTNYGKIELGSIKGTVKPDKVGDTDVLKPVSSLEPLPTETLPNLDASDPNRYRIYKINSLGIDKASDPIYEAYNRYYLFSFKVADEWYEITPYYRNNIVVPGYQPVEEDLCFYICEDKYNRRWDLGASGKAAYFYYSEHRAENLDRTNFDLKTALILDREGTQEHPKKIYIGSDGLLVSDQFRVDILGNVTIGDVTYSTDPITGAETNSVCWKFNTSSDKSRAFMYYSSNDKSSNRYAILNAQGKETSMTTYVGTDGTRIGNIFKARVGSDITDPGGLEIGNLPSRHFAVSERSAVQLRDAETVITAEGGSIGSVPYWGRNGILYENDPYKMEYETVVGRGSINTKHYCIMSHLFEAGDTFYLDNSNSSDGRFICQIKAENFYIGIPDETTPTVEIDGVLYPRTTYVSLADYIAMQGGGGGNLPAAENYAF